MHIEPWREERFDREVAGRQLEEIPPEEVHQLLSRIEHLPSKRHARFQTSHLFLWVFNLFNNLGSLLFAQS